MPTKRTPLEMVPMPVGMDLQDILSMILASNGVFDFVVKFLRTPMVSPPALVIIQKVGSRHHVQVVQETDRTYGK